MTEKYYKWAHFLTTEVNILRNHDIESWLVNGNNAWLEKKLDFKKFSVELERLEAAYKRVHDRV